MNAILGARIRGLRESNGLTQEQIAAELGWSRQKYARLEKGSIDISYACITKIAEIIKVTAEDITSAVNSRTDEHLMFREDNYAAPEDKMALICNMIDTFYAHRRLYYSVRQDDKDE